MIPHRYFSFQFIILFLTLILTLTLFLILFLFLILILFLTSHTLTFPLPFLSHSTIHPQSYPLVSIPLSSTTRLTHTYRFHSLPWAIMIRPIWQKSHQILPKTGAVQFYLPPFLFFYFYNSILIPTISTLHMTEIRKCRLYASAYACE